MAAFAQIAIRIPTTTVPITAGTFGALLIGAALGSKRGGLSMGLYVLVGMVALPVFAPPSSYMADKTLHFILPWNGKDPAFVWDLANGGYIVGFILAAYLVGLLAERGWDRRSSVPVTMIVGNICVYLVGLPWLAAFIGTDATIPGLEPAKTYYDAISGSNVLDKTLKGGLYPFIGGDALKLMAATLVLPGAWAVVDRVKGRPPRE
jgi:biotin transport system substrate-specific component